MVWNAFFFFTCSISAVLTMEGYYQPQSGSIGWGYFNSLVVQRVPPQPPKTPVEAMVDLTNNLGVVILQDHSSSKDNFAFSPYGVASVMVVLYEGARGESARQIHRGVKFPMDRDIVRIGFRDIHLHLRSYFSHEGYLSGINLNKNNSNLKPGFKQILSFYGYSVDFNSTLGEDCPSSTESTKTTVQTPQSITREPDPEPITLVQNKSTENSTVSVGTTVGTLPSIIGIDQDAQKPSTEVTDTDTIQPELNNADKTEPVQTTTELLTTEFKPQSVVTNLPFENESEISPSKDTSLEHPEKELDEEAIESDEVKETTNTNLDNGMLIPQPDDFKTTTEQPTMSTEDHLDAETITSGTTEITTQNFEETTQPTTQMQEMSTYAEAKNETTMPEKADGQNSFSNIRSLINAKASLWLTGASRQKSRRKRIFTDYLKSPRDSGLSFQLQNGMHDIHISRKSDLPRGLPSMLFLLDGREQAPVPIMSYISTFPYAYIPRLHSKALEFPLDDVRYKLLILLPVERGGLRQLIYDLEHFPLRNVLECLRPARVKAMVPTFMVEGFVILTPSLQKLGIWDVFDSQKADLSGMSDDSDLYVRNVEQSVTVVIRNYVEISDSQTRTFATRYIDSEFEATHPFLYFVLDRATNIALMAGQILNPLNTRMY